MAFISKVGNLLRNGASKQASSGLTASSPTSFQAIRCMSSSKLFIGGLSPFVDDSDLKQYFSVVGEVVEARVIMDRETGRSRGFGFVTFASIEDASLIVNTAASKRLIMAGRRYTLKFAEENRRSGGDSYRGRYGGGSDNGGYSGYPASSGGGYNAGGNGGGSGFSNAVIGGGTRNFASGGVMGNFASGGDGYGGSSGVQSGGYGQNDPSGPTSLNDQEEPVDYANKNG